MPTLLHISDLHRSRDEPIDNDTLFAAIVADLDRFALVHERPEALIVSGDLVQGVALGAADYQAAMAEQYETAFDLVGRLCDEFLDGDRSRVVVVPGNHDVCWNSARSAMTLIASDCHPKDLRRALAEREGPWRWCWDELRLHRVDGKEAYASRLDAYWNGVERFYAGVALPLVPDRTRGYHVHRIFGGRAVVAAFESIHGNDHLRHRAGLATGVVARCAMHLRKMAPQPELLIAVWHHSVHGPPDRDDYLDVEHLREMAGHGFQIGFHGHQHLAENTDLRVSVGGGSTMCVVSAGSLCAGVRELPRGINRQYNIVRFDEALASGELHVREMVEGQQFDARTGGRFLGGMAPLSWSPRASPRPEERRDDASRLRALAISVEDATRSGLTSTEVAELVRARPSPGTYPRTVLRRALLASKAWPAILQVFDPPVGAEEAAVVAEAAYQSKDLGRLEAALTGTDLPAVAREAFELRWIHLKTRGTT